MVDLFTTAFLLLLTTYVAYSVWARLDGRLPVAAALVLLLVAAVVDAAGDVTAANALAEYVFFLLGAGVLLLLIEHFRSTRSGRSSIGATAGQPSAEGGEAADQG